MRKLINKNNTLLYSIKKYFNMMKNILPKLDGLTHKELKNNI